MTEFPLFYPLGVYKFLLGWQLFLSPLERWNTRSNCNVTVIFLYLSDLQQNLPFYGVTLKQTVYSRPAVRLSVFLFFPYLWPKSVTCKRTVLKEAWQPSCINMKAREENVFQGTQQLRYCKFRVITHRVRNFRTLKKKIRPHIVNHVYILPPKFSSIIKKSGSDSFFFSFSRS